MIIVIVAVIAVLGIWSAEGVAVFSEQCAALSLWDLENRISFLLYILVYIGIMENKMETTIMGGGVILLAINLLTSLFFRVRP